MERPPKPRRQLDSIVLHFDCFYASVFEQETPALKTLPLAVQQKQILVTCNYEARRRGLFKLQRITDAKRLCPDVVIVLGEDLTRFRDASKRFDEVFMDVSDVIEYNLAMLGSHLQQAFFVLSKQDPTIGFHFDATHIAGHVYPEVMHHHAVDVAPSDDPLYMRLLLASHLAQYLRTSLEQETGYTAAVGISTNKLLSKLVGNRHKPNAQTTLLPPYHSAVVEEMGHDNVTAFVDELEVGKLPGIGFKIAQQLRAKVLGREATFDHGLVYGGTNEHVLVRDVRSHPGMGPNVLERELGGPGAPRGIGARVWGLINGCDEREVGQARDVPRQISIEDSYMRLDTMDEVIRELGVLVKRLLARMHADLLEDVDYVEDDTGSENVSKRWLAHPKTIRLSTRPRPPQNPSGSRNRSFARTSRSAPLPNFAFSLKDGVEIVAEKLVSETLLPLFRKIHPENRCWNLSLVNVAVTNMADAASEKGGVGRDISKMFRHQDDVLKQWKVKEHVTTFVPADMSAEAGQPFVSAHGSEDAPSATQEEQFGPPESWASEDEEGIDVTADAYRCDQCSAMMPTFAIGPHARWHEQQNGENMAETKNRAYQDRGGRTHSAGQSE